ncbi:hypothetical protein [Halomonas binhaiensis]|uniref:Uncharacterized protein n=1 Tax=Halomonas binhaiensis TaxID=2562282 RepID=A0A5C1N9W2_9GAMM|nr:hypothetical protein [Halomonas binhaiensis]QEM80186.1 hypothetical protein E4T21_00420 [Halomonas binhaiensis]
MNDRFFMVFDPQGRVDPYSTATSQSLAMQRFASRRAGRPVRSAVAWLLWFPLWSRGYRIAYHPAIPEKELANG